MVQYKIFYLKCHIYLKIIFMQDKPVSTSFLGIMAEHSPPSIQQVTQRLLKRVSKLLDLQITAEECIKFH